jgi:regulator of protease activity HflC (stomatin/prohibitin superfamily)
MSALIETLTKYLKFTYDKQNEYEAKIASLTEQATEAGKGGAGRAEAAKARAEKIATRNEALAATFNAALPDGEDAAFIELMEAIMAGDE